MALRVVAESAIFDPNDSDESVVLDTEVEVACPHCGEKVVIGLDPGSGTAEKYVEDCQVCCRPWRVRLSYDETGAAEVWVEEMQ